MPKDETLTQQDSLERQASAAQGETSEGKTQTYTKTDVQKQISDALAAAGRDAKSIAAIRKQAESLKADADRRAADVDRREQEHELRERESLSDDPAALSDFQRRADLRKREAETKRVAQEADRKLAEADAGLAEVAQWRREQAASVLASRYAVNASLLLEFTDGTTEKMEKLAQTLSERGANTAPPLPKPDSGVTKGIGQGRTPSLEELRASPPGETDKKVKSGEWVLAGWT